MNSQNFQNNFHVQVIKNLFQKNQLQIQNQHIK
jgi:hypothetical protein